ncbi:hypothetical protein EBU95_02305 [bacterium]|nr:hypothetical protein [bacterium]
MTFNIGMSLFIVLFSLLALLQTQSRIAEFNNTLYDIETQKLDEIFKAYTTQTDTINPSKFTTTVDQAEVRKFLKTYLQETLTRILGSTQFKDSKVLRDVYNVKTSDFTQFVFDVDITNRVLAFTRTLRVHVHVKDYDETLTSVMGILPNIRLLSIVTIAQTDKFTYEPIDSIGSEPLVIKNRYNYI